MNPLIAVSFSTIKLKVMASKCNVADAPLSTNLTSQ